MVGDAAPHRAAADDNNFGVPEISHVWSVLYLQQIRAAKDRPVGNGCRGPMARKYPEFNDLVDFLEYR
jgi:hypothetical protein